MERAKQTKYLLSYGRDATYSQHVPLHSTKFSIEIPHVSRDGSSRVVLEYTDRSFTPDTSNTGMCSGREIHSFIGAIITGKHIANCSTLNVCHYQNGEQYE